MQQQEGAREGRPVSRGPVGDDQPRVRSGPMPSGRSPSPDAIDSIREHEDTRRNSRSLRASTGSSAFTAAFVGLAVAIVLIGMYGPPYVLTVATQAITFAIVVLGLTVLVGYTGQISFAQNAFFGIGAYASALGTTEWSLSPLSAAGLGVLVAAGVAVPLGYPTLRLKGHFLAMATLGAGLGFYSLVVAAPAVNGYAGISGIPPVTVGSLELRMPYQKFWLAGIVLLVAVYAAHRLRSRRYGRAIRSVASDEATARSVGINAQRYKLSAFVISAIFASVGGSVFAHTVNYVSPESFSFVTILTFFMILFIGGMASVWGAVVGAVVVTAVPELLPSAYQEWQPTIFSIVLILVLIISPAGLLAMLSSPGRGRWLGRRAAA